MTLLIDYLFLLGILFAVSSSFFLGLKAIKLI